MVLGKRCGLRQTHKALKRRDKKRATCSGGVSRRRSCYICTAKRGFVLQGWENFPGQEEEEEEEVKNKRLIISSELAATAQTILYAFELCPCRMNAEETAAAIPKGKRNCENVFTRPSSVLHTSQSFP